MDKISIIIPCYNVQEYVDQCLESIISQSHKNLEIICINDGSTDNTLNILKQIQKKDDRIVLINQSNKGLSQTRNVGLDISTGDYVMFVDSDDWIAEELINVIFMREPDIDLYCCSYNRVFKNFNLPRDLNLSGKYKADRILKRLVGLTDEELSDPTQADSLVIACGKIYKAEIIRDNNIRFLETKLIGTEDAFFNIEYSAFCNNVLIVNEPLYFYRRYNANSITSNHAPDLLSKWKKLYELIGEEIKDKDQSFQIALNNRICLGFLGVSLNEIVGKFSEKEKLKRLRQILIDDLYKDSFQKFDFKNMPVTWKVFYSLAKYRSTAGVYVLINVIQTIQKFKNR